MEEDKKEFLRLVKENKAISWEEITKIINCKKCGKNCPKILEGCISATYLYLQL